MEIQEAFEKVESLDSGNDMVLNMLDVLLSLMAEITKADTLLKTISDFMVDQAIELSDKDFSGTTSEGRDVIESIQEFFEDRTYKVSDKDLNLVLSELITYVWESEEDENHLELYLGKVQKAALEKIGFKGENFMGESYFLGHSLRFSRIFDLKALD